VLSLTLPRPPIRIPEELAKELASGPVASERVEPVRLGLREEHRHANGPLFLATAISLRGRHRLPEPFAPALAGLRLFPLHQLEGRELVRRGAVLWIHAARWALPDESLEGQHPIPAPEPRELGDEHGGLVAAGARRSCEVRLHGSPLVKADDDDSSALDEADPEVAAI